MALIKNWWEKRIRTRKEARDKRRILQTINKVVRLHELTAEFLDDFQAVGVVGDQRSLSPVVCLTGKFPGYDVLDELSREISNKTPVTRVTFEIARK